MHWRTFAPYSNDYPIIFAKEKKRLQTSLGNVAIEHFGSTAVPGLGGKGYIDIYMAIPKQEMRKFSLKVQKLDYEHHPGGDVKGERLFYKRKIINKNGKTITYNLHITYLKSDNFKTCLEFRDHLKKHTRDRERYAEAKKIAVSVANKEKERQKAVQVYMESKTATIKKIIQKTSS